MSDTATLGAMASFETESAPGIKPRWAYAVAVVSSLTVLAVVATALIGRPGFPLDDSWIHQTVARNFARYGSLGYLPHQHSSGSTSLLWTLLLSLKYRLPGQLSPVAYALGLNALLLVGTVLLLLRFALRDRMPVSLAVLWALSPLADGNYVWLAFTGMEHLLFVFLSLLSLDLWTAADVPALLPGIALGLLTMTRPEGLALICVLLLLPRLFGRNWHAARVAAVPAVILGGSPFVLNLITSRSLLPLTFKGREWLYFEGQTHGLRNQSHLILSWYHRLLMAFAVPRPGAGSMGGRVADFCASLLIVVLCSAGLVSLWRGRRHLSLLVCLWGMLHSLLYLVILPNTGHGGRYQPFLLLLTFPLALWGVLFVLQGLGRPPAQRIGVALFCLLFCAVISLRLWRATLRAGIAHIEGTHGVMARYLNQTLPGQTVAVFDIGRIGYSFNGHVVDLGGLTDPSYTRYLMTGRVPSYLGLHHVRFVVLPTELDSSSRVADSLRLHRNSQVALTPMFRICSPVSVWRPGFLLTNHALPCQELDQLAFR